MANCQIDLERLISRCEAHLDARSASASGQIKLQSSVAKMDELLALVEKSSSTDDIGRLQRSVERFRALLLAPSSRVAIPAAIRLAVAGGELSSTQKVEIFFFSFVPFASF